MKTFSFIDSRWDTWPFYIWWKPYCPVFLDLIEEFADVIEVQLLAHHHTDSFKASCQHITKEQAYVRIITFLAALIK